MAAIEVKRNNPVTQKPTVRLDDIACMMFSCVVKARNKITLHYTLKRSDDGYVDNLF